jgi:uncharacterized membrane protein YhaH (DUF805 family)
MPLLGLFLNPRGRLGKTGYVISVACLGVVFFVSFIVRHFEDNQKLPAIGLITVLIYSLVCVVTKRNRDAGDPMWRLLFLLVPGLNLIFVLFLWLPATKIEKS